MCRLYNYHSHEAKFEKCASKWQIKTLFGDDASFEFQLFRHFGIKAEVFISLFNSWYVEPYINGLPFLGLV